MKFVVALLVAFVVPASAPSQAAPTQAAPSQNAPTRISAIKCDSAVAFAAPRLSWRGDVVRWAEWRVQLGPRNVAARVIVARVPPAKVRLTLEIARRDDVAVPWSLDEAPTDALIAVNAGQFTDEGPWGWVVHKQRELQPPGLGPLAGAFVVDSLGGAALLTAAELDGWRTPLRAVEAVQSYPMLLTGDARPPRALCEAKAGLDLTHRDTRLAIGVSRDGDVLFALTRYEMPGGTATRFPIGPTTPEMAEIMRRLGANRALMLDGGLSAQMLVRAAQDSARWPGLRNVPLALVARRSLR